MRPICALFLLFFALAWPASLKAQGRPALIPPKLVSMPTPDCVSGKPCHRSHGQVRLIVDVLEDGKIGEIRVETGDAKLTDAAIEAAQQAQFIPGSYLGRPQSMDYVLNIRF